MKEQKYTFMKQRRLRLNDEHCHTMDGDGKRILLIMSKGGCGDIPFEVSVLLPLIIMTIDDKDVKIESK